MTQHRQRDLRRQNRPSAKACQPALPAAQASKSIVFLPIYVTATGNGSNGSYTLKGFAAFVITGYSLPGFSPLTG